MDPDLEARLREFSLSEYQARAYLALLQLGKSEARDVSRLAKVPVAKVYGTLQQLAERGLVTAYAETPRAFAAVPFAEWLGRRQREHEAQIADLERLREELAPRLAPRAGPAADDRGTMTNVRGRASAQERLEEAIRGARERILYAPSPGLLGGKAANRVLDGLRAATERGVDVVILLPRGAHLDAPPKARVLDRDTADPTPMTILATEAEAILLQRLPDDEDLRRGSDLGVLVAHPGISLSLRTLLTPRDPPLVRLHAPSSARVAWENAKAEHGASAIGLLCEDAIVDLLVEEGTMPEERRIFAIALRHRVRQRVSAFPPEADPIVPTPVWDMTASALHLCQQSMERARASRQRAEGARTLARQQRTLSESMRRPARRGNV